MGKRLGPALAGILMTLAFGGCGGGSEDESPTVVQAPSTTGAETLPPAVPPRIVALTEEGDVVLIDRGTKEAQIIATFPPREDPQVEAGSFRAVDVAALPDGRFLLATCCEPAAGHMYALSEDGKRLKDHRTCSPRTPATTPRAPKSRAASWSAWSSGRSRTSTRRPTHSRCHPTWSEFRRTTFRGRPTPIASRSRSEASLP